MKRTLKILLLLYFSNSFGQFAVIQDKDHFVNVRKDGAQNSSVTDQLENGHLIFCFENIKNWTFIDYKHNGKERNGYVYQDRYNLISGFPALKIVETAQNSITLKKDDIEISMFQSKFEKKKHQFKYVRNYPDQLELIDNQQYFGMDGGLPTIQFEKINIKIGQKNITLPKSALKGLYQPSLWTAEVNYDKVNNTIYIQTQNSDGAGSYLVIWKIEKGVYKDRFVAYGF